jgi:hypothetical protein
MVSICSAKWWANFKMSKWWANFKMSKWWAHTHKVTIDGGRKKKFVIMGLRNVCNRGRGKCLQSTIGGRKKKYAIHKWWA